jgi:alcohol dehydrogenase YqhD (iron-dependent ADH family)
MQLLTRSRTLFLLSASNLPVFTYSSGVRMAAHLLASSILFPNVINTFGEEEEQEIETLTSELWKFRNDNGEIENKWITCDDFFHDFEERDDFDEVHEEHSLYQKIIFKENPTDDDKCLRLDDTLQQCSTY